MYGLTRLILARSPFVELTEKEYRDALHAKHCVWQALQIEEKFDLVLSNYEELEQDILEVALQASMYFENDWSAGVDTLQGTNRRLVNLLSTCRLYVDQIRHNLSLMYGPDSPVAEQIKTSCSREYDSRLGYRVMEALRNYVQHRGMPIQRMSLESSWVAEAPKVRKHIRHTVGLYLGVVQLREDGGFKAKILDELAALADEHDLKALIRDYVAGLGCVHETFRKAVASDLERWDAVILDLFARYRAVDGDTLGMGLVRTDGRKHDEMNHVIEDPITRRRALASRNHQTRHYPEAVVTNY